MHLVKALLCTAVMIEARGETLPLDEAARQLQKGVVVSLRDLLLAERLYIKSGHNFLKAAQSIA